MIETAARELADVHPERPLHSGRRTRAPRPTLQTSLLLCALVVLATACNLGIDTEAYPYQGSALIIQLDAGDTSTQPPDDSGNNGGQNNGGTNNGSNGDMDVGADVEVDMSEPGEVRLMITEVLVNTSVMDNQVAVGELGEYVEIKNVGDAHADPRNISFRVSNLTSGSDPRNIVIARPVTSEALDAVNRLQPIPPGGYFVFVRYEVDEGPITDLAGPAAVYDYGRYGDDISISNADERLIELQYNDGDQFVREDSFRWEGSDVLDVDDGTTIVSFEEDDAVGVKAGFETFETRDDPARWCVHSSPMPGGVFRGSPGEAAPSDCQ